MRMYLSIYSLSYLMHSFTALLLFEREKISQKCFFMILKNLVGVCRGTSFKSSFVENLLGNQVTLWIHFLFLMNVLFIWYALWSQQTLSFRAGRILNFFLDPPTYFFTDDVFNLSFCRKLTLIFWKMSVDFSGAH